MQDVYNVHRLLLNLYQFRTPSVSMIGAVDVVITIGNVNNTLRSCVAKVNCVFYFVLSLKLSWLVNRQICRAISIAFGCTSAAYVQGVCQVREVGKVKEFTVSLAKSGKSQGI